MIVRDIEFAFPCRDLQELRTHNLPELTPLIPLQFSPPHPLLGPMSVAPIISTFAAGVSRQELANISHNATSNSAASDHGSESHWATNLFIALHAVALALLLAVVLPAFLSPQVHRMKTWFSFILGWMCFCISYLVIAGHQWGAEPAYSLCLFQAAFVYASPVL